MSRGFGAFNSLADVFVCHKNLRDLLACGLLRGVLDCFDDVLVAGAATEIAIETVTDLFARRIGVALEQLRRSDDHSGCAVPALQSVSFPESFLHRMQFAVLCEAFDRRNR